MDTPVNDSWMQEQIKKEEADKRNFQRIMRAVKTLRGEDYCDWLEDLIIETASWDFCIVREPKGTFDEDQGAWIDQWAGISGDDYKGYVCVRIKPGRWLQWYYEC
jgi:hypothetical protein